MEPNGPLKLNTTECREQTADVNDEAEVIEIHKIQEAPFRQEPFSGAAGVRLCAYNRTRKRFISNDIELVDSARGAIEESLARLGPASGKAIWIFPIRALTPADFSLPVDLLYLDEAYKVLGVVQSYPIGRIPSRVSDAASILILPAESAISAGINEGSKLLVCSADEMQTFLLGPKAEVQESAPALPEGLTQSPVPASMEETGNRAAMLWEWRDPSPPDAPAEVKPENDPEAEAPSAEAESQETESKTVSNPPPAQATTPKKWWQKLFQEEPADSRTGRRHVLEGLVAYFFTGSVPMPHPVRDISTSGLYVLTSERWYRGTVVRITLTDEREPTAERSITVHARVVRSTDEGVALQFLLGKGKGDSGASASRLDPLMQCSNEAQIREFISRFEPAS